MIIKNNKCGKKFFSFVFFHSFVCVGAREKILICLWMREWWGWLSLHPFNCIGEFTSCAAIIERKQQQKNKELRGNCSFMCAWKKLRAEVKKSYTKTNKQEKQNKSRKMWNERSIKERKNLWFNMCVNVNFTHNFFFFFIFSSSSRRRSLCIWRNERKKKCISKSLVCWESEKNS